jgi:hypothetical protein
LRNYVIIDNGSGVGADIEPHASGNIELSLPENWRDAEALLLTAIDPSDKDIYTWSWKIQSSESLTNSFINLKGDNVINIDENDTLLTLVTNDNSISFNKISGLLTSVNTKIKNRSRKIHFNNGPVFCAGNSSFIGLRHYQENGCYVVESSYQGGLKTVRWKLYQNGWLEMTYSYELFGKYDFSGISFDYPEEFVLSAKWLGNGPYRVWKNRMQGVTFNIWENSYNNTFAGTAPWQFPEFKGYFSDIAWMEINTVEGRIFIASKQDDLFVRLFDFYALRGLEKHPVSPTGDISFLDYIPPIGTQMSTRISAQPAKLGPSSEMNKIEGEIKRTLYFYFGELK